MIGVREEEVLGPNQTLAARNNAKLNIDNLINHLVAHEKTGNRNELKLGRFADHQQLDASHNIVHMIFTQVKKDCIVIVRVDDPSVKARKQVTENTVQSGKIYAYRGRVNIQRDTFKKEGQFDLYLRYEQVHHELENIFAEFTDQKCSDQAKYLYVCGYLDNSIKIFDLSNKDPKHLVREIRTHNARVTCIKFSKDYKYLITCDADGVIHHYERNCHKSDTPHIDEAANTTVDQQAKLKKEAKKIKDDFPFTLLYIFQD